MSERKVATDALETLGTIIDENQKRDAIHLAVEPVVAGEVLRAGDHIDVINGVATKTDIGKGLGIVDPFLPRYVREGERFWFVMYPGKVHSLRHVWTHPSFPDATVVAPSGADKAKSERWLREFCDRNGPGYDHVMGVVAGKALPDVYGEGGELTEDSLFIYGRDASGEIPPEFWDHAEVVLGRKVPHRPTYFSCSC